MPLCLWSETSTDNQGGDPAINWLEGQAPSTINNSARAMMAETKKFVADISGAIVTGGTSTAYTVTSHSNFAPPGVGLTKLDGQMIAFTPHTTNGAGPVTLNVDSLGAKPLRSAPGVELPAGVLIQGTPYVALYNHGDGALYLHGMFGNPYLVPIGGVMDFIGSTAPNSSFVLPFGQAISRTTYSTLFALVGTTFGAGDGSTTFNVPDMRGRVVAGADAMGGTPSGRLTDAVSGIDSLGDAGGSQSRTLVTANLPPYTPSGAVNTGTLNIQWSIDQVTGPSSREVMTGIVGSGGAKNQSISSFSGFSFSGTPQGGTSDPVVTVQPTIVLNKILRII